MPAAAHILYCHCAQFETICPDTKEAVLAGLCRARSAFTAIPDLCRLAADRDPALGRMCDSEDFRIAACYPRAVRWLLARCGDQADIPARVSNMRADPPETIIDTLTAGGQTQPANVGGWRLTIAADDSPEPISPTRKAGILMTLLDAGWGATCVAPGASADVTWSELGEMTYRQVLEKAQVFSDDANNAGEQSPDWVPWFPVIDYDRCTKCGKCVSFCLFGTYSRDDDGRVEVQNPANCKTNCPACARVCPHAAIVFAKHTTGPINGDEVEDSPAGAVQIDPAALASGDLYAKLRCRGGADADDSEISKLAEQLEIPPDVLDSLRD